MANIRKQFNFRNGVQVDDDNLIVSSTGLVGIGTSIPTESLDVRGNVKVVGLVTANQFFTPILTSGISTITNLSIIDAIIGAGISVRNGILTSSGVGVVTYYGNGGNLLNLPTSQWLNIDVGFGFTSIYSQGYVGVGTVDPRFLFQISGNTDKTVVGFTSGIGFSSEGNILATGIVTAYKFSGIGSNIIQLNASNIEYGIISNDRIPVLLNSKIPSDINISGVITSSGGFVGPGQNIIQLSASNISTGTLSNSRLPSDINISGVITSSGGFVGNLTGTSSAATSISGNPNISVGLVSATNSISVGSEFKVLSNGNIGIGTTIPTSELQIRKASGSLLQVISDSGSASINIGRVGDSSAFLRFGSTNNTFEIFNNDNGSINSILHNGLTAGINTGRFNWIYGKTNQNLMSLTYDGKLGIGKTDPDNQLHVQGISTVTGNAWFGNNIYVSNTVNAKNIVLTDGLTSNINVLTGKSTFNDIQAVKIGIETSDPLTAIDARSGILLINSIGIGTTVPKSSIDVRDGTILVKSVGVGTTSLYVDPITDFSPEIQTHDKFIGLYDGGIGLYGSNSVGFNTDLPRSILDFGRVGLAATISGYFIAPTVTTTNRNQFSNNTGIGGTVEGAIIYNSTTKKHQGYGSTNGGVTFGWNDLY